MQASPLSAPRSSNHLPATAALSLLTALLVSAPSHAQEREGESSWSLGFGAASTQKPYAGIDRETRALPMIQFENQYVRVQGLGVEAKLPSLVISNTQRFDFSIVGRRALGIGYEEEDAPILSGMEERKGGYWLGAKTEWKNSVLNVSADWTGDASGNSKGQRFNLGVNKPWRFGQLTLIPRLGLTWHDKKYNDYYFGVRDSEARADRAAYQADAGVNVELGLNAMYMFDRHHSMMLGLGVNSLSKEIKDSPLVDRSSENRVFLAYLYRF